MSDSKTETQVIPVEMILLDQKIGQGEAISDELSTRIKTMYNWPPDSVAEVWGEFFFRPDSDSTCEVSASYPGLLAQPVPQQEAGYFEVLIGARPLFNIETPSTMMAFGTTGPFSEPGKVTGYQLQIQQEGHHGLTFTFRFTEA